MPRAASIHDDEPGKAGPRGYFAQARIGPIIGKPGHERPISCPDPALSGDLGRAEERAEALCHGPGPAGMGRGPKPLGGG
ncbi:hypothetical protein EYE42_15285 [Paracoccus subflavus]|uniref:Uncharacterized protein n=1 Tax=Paracoccus subflavus TaxID=2528244 RepID=A0A4Q9FV86_9RHOB|nr:hypothetical protein [Paracoccus subflavus]TBN36780.1 hypothetical protein EYE42_15285 [Paracoccus subflavus]